MKKVKMAAAKKKNEGAAQVNADQMDIKSNNQSLGRCAKNV